MNRAKTCREDGTSRVFENGAHYRDFFQEQTEDIVNSAKRIIETNQTEGAVIDQRWYGLKYFGKHQDRIFSATKVIFFDGLESDVRKQVADRYLSIDPAEDDQDSGNIRLYTGKLKGGGYDFIIVGQNGREVALKTVIRLLYLTRFVDDKTKQKYRGKLADFKNSLQVFLSSLKARDEFVGFFKKHCIDNPDVVMIGFRADIRPLLKREASVIRNRLRTNP